MINKGTTYCVGRHPAFPDRWIAEPCTGLNYPSRDAAVIDIAMGGGIVDLSRADLPKWIDDPHDIDQGQMLNPEWLKANGLTAREASGAISEGTV